MSYCRLFFIFCAVFYAPYMFAQTTPGGNGDAGGGVNHYSDPNFGPRNQSADTVIDQMVYRRDTLQLLVKFKGTVSAYSRDTIRQHAFAAAGGGRLLRKCLCDSLELWELPPGYVEETKKGTSKDTGVQGADKNRFFSNFIQPISSTTTANFSTNNISNAVKVAVLDTGIDLKHGALMPFLWRNPTEIFDNADNDANCLVDDKKGYNFVDKLKDPWDLHGHGTHISGIIRKTYYSSTCFTPNVLQIIPLKTHDRYGRGDLFDAICAMYYAVEKGAKVINCSWGYRGDSTKILYDAIENARLNNVLVVASAGNYGYNTELIPKHFPSGHKNANLISVTALNSSFSDLANFADWGPISIDVAAPGTNILSTYPRNRFAMSSGTSQAAAYVSGVAALLYSKFPTANFSFIKNQLMSSGIFTPILTSGTRPILSPFRVEVNAVLDCAALADDSASEFSAFRQQNTGTTLFPNPTNERVSIENTRGVETVCLMDMTGKVLMLERYSTVTTVSLNLAKYPAGVYFIRVNDATPQKIVKY